MNDHFVLCNRVLPSFFDHHQPCNDARLSICIIPGLLVRVNYAPESNCRPWLLAAGLRQSGAESKGDDLVLDASLAAFRV